MKSPPVKFDASRVQQQLERHREILALVAQSGKVGLSELANRLDVSQETIRRDVRELDRLGKVRKVHGGVVGMEAGTEPEFQIRLREQEDIKKRLGRAFAEVVRQDDSMIFGTGSTVYYAAQALRAHDGLFTVTNCIEIARLFTTRQSHRVLFAGGDLRPGDGAALGPQAIAFVKQVHVSWAIISADGIDSDGMITVSNLADADYLRCIIQQAARVAVLITPEKIMRRSLIQIGLLKDVSVLVCDEPLPSKLSELLASGGGKVVMTKK